MLMHQEIIFVKDEWKKMNIIKKIILGGMVVVGISGAILGINNFLIKSDSLLDIFSYIFIFGVIILFIGVITNEIKKSKKRK